MGQQVERVVGERSGPGRGPCAANHALCDRRVEVVRAPPRVQEPGDERIAAAERGACDLDGINRGASRFDFGKLGSINAHYLRAMDDDDLLTTLVRALPDLTDGPEFSAKLTDERRQKMRAAMPLLKDRAKTLVDLIDRAHFIVAERPLKLDAAAAVLIDASARGLLARLLPVLAALPDWPAATTEAAVKAFAEREDIKLGAVAQPLRAALTGRTASPGIFDVLAILGRDESLGRIADTASG